jgi:HEAT repeat protein
MPIVPSRARRIQELIRDLRSTQAARRESAVAQLTLLGPRAVDALLRALPTAGSAARLAALEVLDRLRDPRALPEVLALAQSADAGVAERALEVLGAFTGPKATAQLAKSLGSSSPVLRRAAAIGLVRHQAAGVVEATEPLLDVLMDEAEDDELRLFVLDSLAALDPPLDSRTLRPLLERLRASADATVADRAASLLAREGEAASGVTAPALHERLHTAGPRDVDELERDLDHTSDPARIGPLADALGRLGGPSSLPVLSRALERLSAPDDDERVAAARATAKGRIHVALAALDSRLALFDLREMLRARPPRALPFLLEAADKVGDASVALALAALAADGESLLDLCAPPFAAIVRRHRLRASQASFKSARAEHREALRQLFERAAATKPGPAGKRKPSAR